MLALLLFIVFGLCFGYFATLNTTLVSINFGFQTISHIPIYVLIIVSFALGVILASVLYSIKSLALRALVHKKESEYEESQKMAAEYLKKAHQVELENAKLKGKKGVNTDDEESI